LKSQHAKKRYPKVVFFVEKDIPILKLAQPENTILLFTFYTQPKANIISEIFQVKHLLLVENNGGFSKDSFASVGNGKSFTLPHSGCQIFRFRPNREESPSFLVNLCLLQLDPS